MRKAILKLNWNLVYMGDADKIMQIADALDKLTPVQFEYLDDIGGVYVQREDVSEPELEFLNRKYLTVEAFNRIKRKEKEAA